MRTPDQPCSRAQRRCGAIQAGTCVPSKSTTPSASVTNCLRSCLRKRLMAALLACASSSGRAPRRVAQLGAQVREHAVRHRRGGDDAEADAHLHRGFARVLAVAAVDAHPPPDPPRLEAAVEEDLELADVVAAHMRRGQTKGPRGHAPKTAAARTLIRALRAQVHELRQRARSGEVVALAAAAAEAVQRVAGRLVLDALGDRRAARARRPARSSSARWRRLAGSTAARPT